MSQILGAAHLRKHVNTKGETIFDKYTTSGLEGPTKNWSQQSIRDVIEFLRREGLIRIYREYRQEVEGKDNIGYEIVLTAKGVEIAANRRFIDYYREIKEKEDEKILSVREKKTNIYLPIIGLLISTVVSIFIWYDGKGTDKKVDLLTAQIDSIQRNTLILARKVDSLTHQKKPTEVTSPKVVKKIISKKP